MTGRASNDVAARRLHIVQIGWDRALLTGQADSRERQLAYAQRLVSLRPGSRMTVIVLGAEASDRPWTSGPLDVRLLAGRWQSLRHVGGLLGALDREAAVSAIAVQSPFEEGWAALRFARRRVPVVAQLHFDIFSDAALPGGSMPRRLVGQARRAVALGLLNRYRAVRTVSPETRDKLAARGVRNVTSIPVPILDLARFEAVAERTREPRVLFVGRLEAEKNLPLWLAVARRVADRVPDARFDIVGGGRLASSVAEMAGRLDLADRVVLHGTKNRDALPEIFGRAAVLLLTSDHEGFGRVLVEAMAAGTAVVSTRTSGAREVIGDSGAGLLAETGDENGLADHVAALLGDPAYAVHVAKLGRERVRGRYDPLRLADAWVDMLIAAADGHRGPMPEPDETPCRES